MKVVVVVAHPDDEALGCGGTIARWSAEGAAVTVLLPLKRRDPRGISAWDALLTGFERSCEALGATPALPAALMNETDAETRLNELHDVILPWIERADLVLTHWPGDVNQVHRGVSRAVEIATRPFRRRRDVSCFEVPTSTEQGFGGAMATPFAPNEYVVLTEAHVRAKLKALDCYPSELDRGRRPEDVERRLRLRGSEIGGDYAEAFVVARRFR